MDNQIVTQEKIIAFGCHLQSEQRSAGTIDKYRRDVRAFANWLGDRPASKEMAVAWREQLLTDGYRPVTVNSMLAALNRLFVWANWPQCHVKALRLQRRLFRERSRELDRREYDSLVDTARRSGRERLALLMETICATGIRVSEVKNVTVEAARQGQTEITLKGKIRTILLPRKLCRKLLQYAKKQKIAFGEIFLTKSGKSLSRTQIWAEMKSVCKKAGVRASKVFPHNLRHLFARTFYRVSRDVAKLADVLGHTHLETTRIYLISSGEEHAKELERLRLIH